MSVTSKCFFPHKFQDYAHALYLDTCMSKVFWSQLKLKSLVLPDLKQKLYISHNELTDIHLVDPTEEKEAAVAMILGTSSLVVREEMDFNV